MEKGYSILTLHLRKYMVYLIMVKSYSTDLRLRVLDYVSLGNTIESASEIFKVSERSINYWKKQLKEEGNVSDKQYGNGRIRKVSP